MPPDGVNGVEETWPPKARGGKYTGGRDPAGDRAPAGHDRIYFFSTMSDFIGPNTARRSSFSVFPTL